MTLYSTITLHTTADSFTLEPISRDGSPVKENVVIDRSTGNVQVNSPPTKASSEAEAMTIYGIIGFPRLLAGEYMIVITDRTKVGRIGEHDIYKVKDYKVLPLSRNNMALTEAQVGEEASYLSLLHAHLQSAQFHFSYTYDLTHTLQRQSQLRQSTKPIYERADERFFWNRRLQTKFITYMTENEDSPLAKSILPIVNGFAEIKSAEINKKAFTFALISRRSRHRVGTRYFTRGVDSQGNVANFNETEQIIIADAGTDGTTASALPGEKQIYMSHVQTRGSIPIYWTQINNIKYTPKLHIFEDPETENSFRKHFETQKQLYGSQLVINLINKKGYEGPMGVAFQKHIDILNDPDIKYHHFDFHHECSKMRWHRVSLLLDHFNEELQSQGYFKAEFSKDGTEKVLQQQTSIVRTNCMDCLDRTNVVQSVVSRWVLNRQLREIGILGADEKFEMFEPFELLFRNVWADNADVISCAYSGTGALKTDFTRTGNRTKAGALQDLQNSIVRYIKNNFLDGNRQDAYDLFLLYDVDRSATYPLVDKRTLQMKAMPIAILVGIIMIFGAIIIPEDHFSTPVILFISFWLAVITYMFQLLVANGAHYVNWPRLVPLPHISSGKLVAAKEKVKSAVGLKSE
ncbi:SacI homology domain-domain-containing protein [Lobosporangium transversale]|uniref:SacI homology domain-domain-containing protein n=1 Tax=Lobosporangium transversale TaxID=64571 RepID=A0A1Y2GZ06_9FUNG|nr:SacI homology domain-domain-containing protein [Lobosporangium transversale]ORZ26991.1 SacI homology domain-domain-containing protein [Lobosporangium transversale]|eukprot:XP_021884738.1 SacI homology domain-domain-containing protein [Lobosporangium transversale]